MPVSPLEEGTELHLYLDEGEENFRFVITENAGSGSFGNTYVATDAIFGDLCVIKEFAFGELCSRNTLTGTIVPYKSRNPQIDKKRLKLLIKWQDRFELEALNLVTIYHTNVISVRLVWRERGTVFYAMNRVEGEELKSPDQEGWQPKSWAEVEPIAFKLLDALEAVHEVNLIHGDVKPGNVLLTNKGEPILIDFGTARNLAEFQATLSANTHAYTPGYAPPELHGVEQTKDVTPSADLYSWAMTIVGLLAKHPKTTFGGPLSAVSRLQSLFFKRSDPYSNLASLLPNVPSNAVEVLQKCLQLDFTERPLSVAETRKLFACKPMVIAQVTSENPVLINKIERLQKTLEEKQSKITQAEQALKEEKTRAERERIKAKQASENAKKALKEEKKKAEREKIRAEQAEKALQKAEQALKEEKKRVEREKTKAEQALKEEKKRTEREKTKAEVTEQALREEKTKAEQSSKGVKKALQKAERELQKEKIKAKKAEQALQKAERELQKEKLKQEKISRKPIEKPKDVLIVDGGKTGFRTINEALKIALAQTTIRIMPGIYRESLEINKDVTVIGIGKCEQIVIIGSQKSAISSTAKQARLQNLTLKQEGSGNNSCVDISSGEIHIEGCDISGKQDNCVAVHGVQSMPVLKNNRIHDAKNAGIFISNDGKGTFDKNEIFNNDFGIAVTSVGASIVSNNKIYNNKEFGILISDNGKGTFEQNETFNNGDCGILVKTGGDPIIRNNQSHNNKRDGIVVFEGGKGTFEQNKIFKNELYGIVVLSGGDPLVRNNKSYNNERSGIYIFDNGKGTFEQNETFNNKFSGILVASGGDPIVRNNWIYDNENYEIYFYSDSKGTFEQNVFSKKKEKI